jgi:predicted RNA-binding Zn ribbon-like protein
MFKLDDNFLHQLGLGGLPVDEKNRMLAHIYETLEMRVGMRLAEQMTDEQLDEFEGFIDTNDEAGALKWLETNFPDYKQVVAEELEKLKMEIQQSAAQILAASQAERAAQAVPPEYNQPISQMPPQQPAQELPQQPPQYPQQPAA